MRFLIFKLKFVSFLKRCEVLSLLTKYIVAESVCYWNSDRMCQDINK